MNSLYKFTHKRLRVLCIYRSNKVCLELLSYLKSVTHIINTPHLLGLYGENRASSHTFNNLSIIAKLFNSYIIATKEYPFHPLNNPSELQDEGTSAQFIFLVYGVRSSVDSWVVSTQIELYVRYDHLCVAGIF